MDVGSGNLAGSREAVMKSRKIWELAGRGMVDELGEEEGSGEGMVVALGLTRRTPEAAGKRRKLRVERGWLVSISVICVSASRSGWLVRVS